MARDDRRGRLPRRGRAILLAAMVAYVVVVGGAAVHRYRAFDAGTYDLGIMEQIFWNTSHGRILTESVNAAHPVSRTWSGRWEAVYLPIAVLHRVFPYAETALIVQTIWLALGAIPLYRLAVDRLGTGSLSVAFPLAYLLHPALQNANLFDIHGITMATPAILFAFDALNRRSMNAFLFFSILLLLCREDAAFPAFMLGLYAVVVSRERRAGAAVMAAGVAWFLFTQNFSLLRPALGLPPVTDPNVFPSRWAQIGGGSPAGFVMAFLRDPLGVLALFADVANGKLLLKLFGPVGFLSALSPSSLAILLPNLAINMMGTSATAKNIYHHYTGAITPVVFLSAVLGTANLLRFVAVREGTAALVRIRRWVRPPAIAAGILAASLAAALLWSRVPAAIALPGPAHPDAIEAVLAQIPPGASLSTHFLLGPHVAQREEFYLFPDRVGGVDYVLYDLDLPFTRLMSHTSNANPAVPPDNEAFRALLDDPGYGIVAAREGTLLFRRGANHAGGLRRLGTRERAGEGRIEPVELGTLVLDGVREAAGVGYEEPLLHLQIDWRWRGGGLPPPSEVTLVLVAGDVQRIFRYRPFFGRLAAVEWTPGDRIRDDAYVPVAGLPAGACALRLRYPGGVAPDRQIANLLIPEGMGHE